MTNHDRILAVPLLWEEKRLVFEVCGTFCTVVPKGPGRIKNTTMYEFTIAVLLVPIFCRTAKFQRCSVSMFFGSVCCCVFNMPPMAQSSLLWLTHEHKQRHFVETLRGNPGCMQTNKTGGNQAWTMRDLEEGPNTTKQSDEDRERHGEATESTEKVTEKTTTKSPRQIVLAYVREMSCRFLHAFSMAPFSPC